MEKFKEDVVFAALVVDILLEYADGMRHDSRCVSSKIMAP